MTTAILPFDPEFSAAQGGRYPNGATVVTYIWIEYASQELRDMAKGIAEFGRQIGEALMPIMKSVVSTFTDLTKRLRAAGMLPPLPTEHGIRWTDIDGKHWKVTGRRGRPHTYHWSECGPTRWKVIR